MRLLVTIQFALLCQMSYIAGDSRVRSPRSVLRHHKGAEDPLSITVLYEALCGDCVRFDREQLSKAWIRFKDHLQLYMVPFGNAKQSFIDGHWVFECQHGPEECIDNKLHACAIDQACPSGKGTADCSVTGVTQALGFISCLMNTPGPQLQATKKCAKIQKLDADCIIECAKHQRGEILMNTYGNYTESLTPKHEYVPWVLVNGKHNPEAEDDLIRVICAARPTLCSRSHRFQAPVGPHVQMV